MSEKDLWIKTVIQQFENRLLRYTGRFVSAPNAKEIVQETFLRLWQQDRSKLEGHLAQWLFTVCRNQALDRCRKDGRTAALGGLEIPAQSVDFEYQLDRSRQRADLNGYLSRLPAEQQEVLRLKFEESMSYKEISAVTGHSVSYVGVLIHEAINELRKHYE